MLLGNASQLIKTCFQSAERKRGKSRVIGIERAPLVLLLVSSVKKSFLVSLGRENHRQTAPPLKHQKPTDQEGLFNDVNAPRRQQVWVRIKDSYTILHIFPNFLGFVEDTRTLTEHYEKDQGTPQRANIKFPTTSVKWCFESEIIIENRVYLFGRYSWFTMLH